MTANPQVALRPHTLINVIRERGIQNSKFYSKLLNAADIITSHCWIVLIHITSFQIPKFSIFGKFSIQIPKFSSYEKNVPNNSAASGIETPTANRPNTSGKQLRGYAPKSRSAQLIT